MTSSCTTKSMYSKSVKSSTGIITNNLIKIRDIECRERNLQSKSQDCMRLQRIAGGRDCFMNLLCMYNKKQAQQICKE